MADLRDITWSHTWTVADISTSDGGLWRTINFALAAPYPAVDDGLTPGGDARFLTALELRYANLVSLLEVNISLSASGQSDHTVGDDLSSEFETIGVLTLASGGRTLALSMSSQDTAEPYNLNYKVAGARAFFDALFATPAETAVTFTLPVSLAPPPDITGHEIDAAGKVLLNVNLAGLAAECAAEIEYRVDGGAWQHGGFTPLGITPATTADQDMTDDFVPAEWTDDRTGVDAEHRYEYCSGRVGSTKNWGKFSTPALVGNYARDGKDGPPGPPGFTHKLGFRDFVTAAADLDTDREWYIPANSIPAAGWPQNISFRGYVTGTTAGHPVNRLLVDSVVILWRGVLTWGAYTLTAADVAHDDNLLALTGTLVTGAGDLGPLAAGDNIELRYIPGAAPGAPGAPGAPARPPTVVNLVYDAPQPAGADAGGAGEYRFGSVDGATVYSTPEDIAQDNIRLTVSGTASDDVNRNDTYFRDLEAGDTLVLYKDLWWIAWSITAPSGPLNGAWDMDLTLLDSHGAPADALAGVEVRIGFDRTPSQFTQDVLGGTLVLDSAANRHVLVYPGDGYLRLFWDVNSGSRELDSDVYARGAQIRYRAKGETDWTLHRPDSPERWPPETITGLTNGTTYEIEIKLAYRVAPTYVLVFGDVFVVDGTPAAPTVEVLAEYEVTVGEWVDDDGSDSFTGFFPRADIGANAVPGEAGGSLRVITAHPDADYSPVGAVVFSRERIGRTTEATIIDFLLGGTSRGQTVTVPNDNEAFVTLQLVGFENLSLVRTSANYRQGDYSLMAGYTAWSWSVDSVPWGVNQTRRVKLLRTPAPDIGTVRHFEALGGDSRALLFWFAPLNSDEAGLKSFRIRYRIRTIDGQSAWQVAADDIAATSTSSYTITGLTNGTAYDVEVAARGINGHGPADVAVVAVNPSVIGRYWLESDGWEAGRAAGLGWWGPRPKDATFSSTYTFTAAWRSAGVALELPEPIARRYSVASRGALAGDYSPQESRLLRFYQFADWQEGISNGDELLRVAIYSPYLRSARTPFSRITDNIWDILGLTRITLRTATGIRATYPVSEASWALVSARSRLQWTSYDASRPLAERRRYPPVVSGEVEFIR